MFLIATTHILPNYTTGFIKISNTRIFVLLTCVLQQIGIRLL